MKYRICDVDIFARDVRETDRKWQCCDGFYTHKKKDLEKWEGKTGWIEESSNPMEPNTH